MIYIIGGSPRCGKTILAKRLARRLNISWITTDAIHQIVYYSLPKSIAPKKFPQSRMKTPRGKFRLDVYSAEAMLKGQLVEANSMWPGTKAFLELLIGRDEDYIIEGVHLLPRFVHSFLKNNPHTTRAVYLGKRHLEKIIDGFSRNTKEYDWMLPAIQGDRERLEKAARMVQVKSEYFFNETKKYHLKMVNTESDFNSTIRLAESYLLK